MLDVILSKVLRLFVCKELALAKSILACFNKVNANTTTKEGTQRKHNYNSGELT